MKHFFTWDEIMRDLVIVLVFIFLVYVSANITPITFSTIFSGDTFMVLVAYLQGKVDLSTAQNVLFSLQNVFTVIGLIFLAGIFWTIIKINEIHHSEHIKYKPIPVEEIVEKEKMTQWQVVLEHINSENQAEWKLAILEADDMFDGILEDQGYMGDTLADKLKAMNPARLTSYSDVWEAHKLRNQIAHGGALDMDITKKMAQDAIAHFGNAFRDLGYL